MRGLHWVTLKPRKAGSKPASVAEQLRRKRAAFHRAHPDSAEHRIYKRHPRKPSPKTKVVSTKPEVRRAAEKLGHDLKGFQTGGGMACAVCRTCGAWVQIDARRVGVPIIIGPALQNRCAENAPPPRQWNFKRRK